MGLPQYQVYHFPKGESGSINITDAVDVLNNDGINVKAGIYTLTLKNKDYKYAGDIKYGDKLKLSMGYEESGLTIIEYGKIEEEEYQFNSNISTKIVKGYGPSREMQNFLVNQRIESGTSYVVGTATYGYDEMNSRNAVKYLVNEFINNGGIGESGDISIDYNTYVDVDSGCKSWGEMLGSAFFKVWVNTPVSKVIDEIRTDSFTGNGDYNFYIDNDNKLHFETKGTSVSTMNLIEGSNIVSYTFNRNIKPIGNMVTVFCGRDSNDLSLYVTGYNSTSIAQYGIKQAYVNRGELWVNVSGLLSGRGYTLQQINDATILTGSKIAFDIALNNGLPRWGGDFTLRGTTIFDLGSNQYVNVYLPSVSDRFNPGSLILTDVKHTFNSRGWTTTISLEEKNAEVFN